MSFLISAGANVHTKDNQGRTPLHWAAAKTKRFVFDENYINAVKLLVLYGADVNAKDKGGKTPLDLAKDNENTAVAEYLASIVAE